MRSSTPHGFSAQQFQCRSSLVHETTLPETRPVLSRSTAHARPGQLTRLLSFVVEDGGVSGRVSSSHASSSPVGLPALLLLSCSTLPMSGPPRTNGLCL